MLPNSFSINTEHFTFSGLSDADETSVICSFQPDHWTGLEHGLFVARNKKDLMEKLEAIRSELAEIIHDIDYSSIYRENCWNILPEKEAEEKEAEKKEES